MSKISEVVIVRHGDKKKDVNGVEVLTHKGTMQIHLSVALLSQMTDFSAIVYSGEQRTLQCATIAQLLLEGVKDLPEIHKGLHFQEAADRIGFDESMFPAEHKSILEAGNTITAGIKRSQFARELRWQLIPTVIELAKLGNVLGFSHSPLSSLAAPDLNFVYDIGNADAVIYRVSGNEILSAEHFICPIK